MSADLELNSSHNIYVIYYTKYIRLLLILIKVNILQINQWSTEYTIFWSRCKASLILEIECVYTALADCINEGDLWTQVRWRVKTIYIQSCLLSLNKGEDNSQFSIAKILMHFQFFFNPLYQNAKKDKVKNFTAN